VGLAPLPSNPLEVLSNGLDQPFMVIRDDDVHSTQVKTFEPREAFTPTGVERTIAQHEAQDLPITVDVHAIGQHHTPGTNAPLLPHLKNQGIHNDKGKAAVSQVVSVPGGDNGVEALAQLENRGLRKLDPSELFCNLCHFSSGNAIDHHLHQRQNQRLLTLLIAGK